MVNDGGGSLDYFKLYFQILFVSSCRGEVGTDSSSKHGRCSVLGNPKMQHGVVWGLTS